jgi:hypothetical protein
MPGGSHEGPERGITPPAPKANLTSKVEGVDNLVLDDVILLIDQLEKMGITFPPSLRVEDLPTLVKMLEAIAQRLHKPLAKYPIVNDVPSAASQLTMGQILDGLKTLKANEKKVSKEK